MVMFTLTFRYTLNALSGTGRIVSTCEDYVIMLNKPSLWLIDNIFQWSTQLLLEKVELTPAPLVTIVLEATIGNEKCQVPRSMKFQALGKKQE